MTATTTTPNPDRFEVEEFDARLERAREGSMPVDTDRYIDGVRVVWAPLSGSQTTAMDCPFFEVLFQGTRGNGKSDWLIMDFAQHVGKGFGPAWRGIIFRRTYPELADIVAKSEKWFRQIFPEAKFNRAPRMAWEWPTGESLLFRHMLRPADYWSYHGHEYPWQGWEELSNWATDECYRRMLSCCRSSTPGVPRRVRSNSNPYGPGSNWIKERWRLHGGRWRETIIIDDAKDANGDPEPTRVAIHGHIDENKILLAADPNYKQTIAAAATNQAMLEAWLQGSWDITAGGMFDDVWSRDRNDVGDFEVPESWSIDRAFDWGSSKPFSVGWYAKSDGTDLVLRDGTKMSTVPGDVFRFREWYGWTGRPNEGKRMLAVDIARGIVEREIEWGLRNGWSSRVSPGPADSAIFATENGVCIAEDMERSMLIDGESYPGVSWLPADKGPGSRKNGWERMRQMIRNASPKNEGEPREEPGFFVVGDRCSQFLRTVLTLPRSEKDMDDVDTDAEDHIGDEVRYRLSGGARSEVSVTEI